MKLSKRALVAINTVEIRLSLAIALFVTEQTIIRYIERNDDNLTKMAAMIVIREKTGLIDEEILIQQAA